MTESVAVCQLRVHISVIWTKTIWASLLAFHLDRKGSNETFHIHISLLQKACSWYLWRIWVIIDIPYPACCIKQGRVVCYKLSSNQSGVLWLGSPAINSPVVGGAPGYGFHPSQDSPGSGDQLTNLQFTIMGKLGIKSFAHTPGASDIISI